MSMHKCHLGAGLKVNKGKGSKSKACQHETEAGGVVLEADLGEVRAPDAAVELTDDLEAEAAKEQPEDSEPAESDGAPLESGQFIGLR